MDRDAIPYVEDYDVETLGRALGTLKRFRIKAETDRGRRLRYVSHSHVEGLSVSHGLLDRCLREAEIEAPELPPREDLEADVVAAIQVLISLREEVSQGELTQRCLKAAIDYLDLSLPRVRADALYAGRHGRPARDISPLAVIPEDRVV